MVEQGKVVLAEFAYSDKLSPSFPRWFNDGIHATFWVVTKEKVGALYLLARYVERSGAVN